jgi:hypothetical protein
LAEGGREKFKHGIVIEEAHHVLLRKKQEVTGEEAVTDVILREIRELGEAVVVLDQHPSLISKPALGNTYCTVSMNLKHRGDISMIADSILLDAERARYLGKLEVGWGMVKLQGRWFQPFLVKFPYLKVEKGAVGDEELRRHADCDPQIEDESRESRRLSEKAQRDKESDFGRKGSLRLSCVAKGGISGIPEMGKNREKLQVGAGSTGGEIRLGDEEMIFLDDVQKNEVSSVSDRYLRLGLSARRGHKLKTALLGNGLISEENVAYGCGRLKLLGLTGRGREVLGLKQDKGYRQGGLAHRFYLQKAAEHFKAEGYNVHAEFPIGDGRTVDLVALKGMEKVAVEVETGKSDPAANIAKCLSMGFHKTCLVPTNKEIESKLQQLVAEGGFEGRVEILGLGTGKRQCNQDSRTE